MMITIKDDWAVSILLDALHKKLTYPDKKKG